MSSVTDKEQHLMSEQGFRLTLRQRMILLGRKIAVFVVVLLLSYGALHLEKLMGVGEKGLGKHPDWTSHEQTETLQTATVVHDQFCQFHATFKWDKLHDYYAEDEQRKFTENCLGTACVIAYSRREEGVRPEFKELLAEHGIDAEQYFRSISAAHFDFRWVESETERNTMFGQSGHLLDDPAKRRRFLAQLSEWYRNKPGRKRIGHFIRFANWYGPHHAFIHESGEQAAFQKFSYGKHGKRIGWVEQTQYFKLIDGEWKASDYELKYLDEEPEGA